jgi:hypothetical protein
LDEPFLLLDDAETLLPINGITIYIKIYLYKSINIEKCRQEYGKHNA